MPLLSRIFGSSKNCSEAILRIRRRFGGSNSFSSSACARPGPTNARLHPSSNKTLMRKPECQTFYQKYGSFIRFYSSGTSPARRTKPPFSSHERVTAPTTLWRHLLIPCSVLAGIGGLVLFIHNNDERRAVQKGMGVKYERSAIQGPIVGGPFSLIDTEGHIVTEKKLLGNWVLLYFGYTSSPDVGPAEVRKMANAINILEESKQNIKVLPIFVTIDPQRDTPSHLRAYIREFDPKIVGLTGPVAAVRQMAQEFRVFFRKIDEEGDDYLIETSHTMYLMSPNMEVSRSFGVEYCVDELADAITKEIKKTEASTAHD